MAFKIAGSMAFKEAMRKADPVILEPIMKVAVIVPDEYMGDVIGDLNACLLYTSWMCARMSSSARMIAAWIRAS